MVSSTFWPEDLPLPFAWKDLPSLLQVDHYLFLRLAHTRYPQVLNFDILVNWCQPDVVNLINHVHPFLVSVPGVRHLVLTKSPGRLLMSSVSRMMKIPWSCDSL